LRYVRIDYRHVAPFGPLKAALGRARRPLFHMAVPPSIFGHVVEGLGAAGLARDARLLVEKPFGRDLAGARALDRTLRVVVPEEAIFRIDHYLGKEAVLNLLYFRFTNPVVDLLFRREHVESVQVTMAERAGVHERGAFYDETGAIRDVVQNHLLQVIACVAMEPTTSFRDESARLLEEIAPLGPADVVRGQFRGYRDEPGVDPRSTVETFAAARLAIDSARWAGVPFHLRAGKRLATTATEVFVALRCPPHSVLGEAFAAPCNHLRFRLGPDVTIALGLRSKIPGEGMAGELVELQACDLGEERPLPYERLLGDAMRGDPTLFATQATVEAQWRVVDGVLGDVVPLDLYEPETWGPATSERLAPAVGWRDPR
jgi:glucose-6-phosphate 1-dehydrogenase